MGAAIAVAALARGISERAVLAYAAIFVVGTAALGTTLSLVAGDLLADIDWSAIWEVEPSALLGAVEVAIGAALLWWAFRRTKRPDERPKRPRRSEGTGEAALIGIAVLSCLSMVADPTFVGLVVVAGRDEPFAAVALAQTTWIVISQLPLVVLAGAIVIGAQARVVDAARRFWARVAPTVRIVLTATLFVTGIVFGADGISQLVTGEYIVG